jgi:hypothetical protein
MDQDTTYSGVACPEGAGVISFQPASTDVARRAAKPGIVEGVKDEPAKG